MKPETKFKRAVLKLAKTFGLVASVNEFMGGLDSRTKEAWRTFSLKIEQDEAPPAEFLSQLEEMNCATYQGKHAMTGLPFNISMAVRNISIVTTNKGTKAFSFFKGTMTAIA